ncbi:Ty3/Gypsy polyprotein/retrotransposon, putative [Rhizoctonia solani AG-3 Rhs1AP]|uniref:Ty3/Gypsy polyprotein/retrotransposon, putative n=2 Tax=Rhizoctonia solani AG-3 TaxID=1086053 RepID=X8J2N4_9AGAM|nr:Ty3/Gypsy polyprotein/retrotransposon, putative [Rhizoctonia solani AG-3 Rhs1AP]KEP46759.1 putative Ty3/Gypsy polyprotein/retrotransposon [Rhizoctonia solani 123E]
MARPPGTSFLGSRATTVPAKIGNLEEKEISIIIDSGSDITLIGKKYYESMISPPKAKTGKNVQLQQVTGKSSINQFIEASILFETSELIIKMKVDAYIVPNMNVPFILGNDFAGQYKLSILREPSKTYLILGDSLQRMEANESPTNPRTDDSGNAFNVSVEENASISSKSTKAKISKDDSINVPIDAVPVYLLNSIDLKPESMTKVSVSVKWGEQDEEGYIERCSFVRNKDSDKIEAWCIPDCIISKGYEQVQIANFMPITTHLEQGQILGYMHHPNKSLNVKSELSKEELNSGITKAKLIRTLLKENKVSPPSEEEIKLSTPAQGGPKTSELPDPEVIPSERLLSEVHFGENLTDDQKKILSKIIVKNEQAFGLDGRLGHYPAEVEINLRPGTKEISLAPYSASPVKQEVINKQIDDWLRLEVIEPSKSAWGFPVLIVWRNNKPRFCIDYRKLNDVAVPDEFPLPKQTDILHALEGSQYLTTLDALAGFTQLKIKEEDRPKTAFRCHRGLFQFKRLPFGFRNGPSVFQRVMNNVLAPFLWIFALVYIDDIVIYSKTFEEHCIHLDKVFKAITESGITLSPNKCHIGYQSLILLGQRVSRLGLYTHKEKVEAIVQLSSPTNKTELQKFLGMVGYFSSYIPFYAWITAPLYPLLRKSQTWKWSEVEQRAFELAKIALVSTPVMAYPKVGMPYRLYTDASNVGLAAILQQIQQIAIKDMKGTKLILISAERNYSATEREALALKEGLRKFHPYLEGQKFLAITDHAALVWSTTYEMVNTQLQKYGMTFSAFPGMKFVHRAGRVHSNVDPISRLRRRIPNQDGPLPDESLALKLTPGEDPLKLLYKEIGDNNHNPLNPPFPHYKVGDNGLLYFVRDDNYRLCVPKELQNETISSMHDQLEESAHAGSHRLYNNMASIYYWPRMMKAIEEYVTTCDPCQKAKPDYRGQRGFLQPIPIPSQPFEVVTMDFIMDLPISKGYNAILTIVDKLTKYAFFLPCVTTINEEETAKLFYDNVWIHYGLPRQVITDRDSRWTGSFWEHLTTLVGIQRSLTTAYHPQADGQSEVMNQTLEVGIRCFVEPTLDNWSDLLNGFTFAYNTTVHTATGFAPSYLLYGYTPLKPSDLLADTSRNIGRPKVQNSNAETFAESIEAVCSQAQDALRIAQSWQEHYYNQGRHYLEFEPGDKVLINPHSLSLLKEKGKGVKLRMKFDGPFEVSQRVSSVSYRLKLPSSYKMHPVINLAHLKPYKTDKTGLDRPKKHLNRKDFNESPEYEVEAILDEKWVKRKHRRVKLYYVSFVGYTPEHNLWLTKQALTNAEELVQEWEASHGKPPPKQTRN